MKKTLLNLAFITFLTNYSSAQIGGLDNTFDSDGKVTTAISSGLDNGNSVAIQSDGKILVAGTTPDATLVSKFFVTRYNTDGSIDNTFDTDGTASTVVGSWGSNAKSIAIQSDGKIVVAGYSHSGASYDFAIVRYNSDGSLDNTFDTDGKVLSAIGTGHDYGSSVAIQTDGKIVIVGQTKNGTYLDFAIARYNSDGSIDNTFDTDGKQTISIGNNDYASDVKIQSDGKIVSVGYYSFGTNRYGIGLIRLNSNGSSDTGFNTGGIQSTVIGNTEDKAYGLAIQSDGKILVAGYSNNGVKDNFALLRYNTNGTIDNTFDTDGIITTALGTDNDRANALTIQSDGKIILTGFSRQSYNSQYVKSNFALVRYNSNGSLDNTFDTDGKVTTAINNGDDGASSIALQSDGKIILAGTTGYYNDGYNTDIALVRYSITPSICDSWTPSTIITISNNILTAQENGANYQWINCSNSNSIITGETAQSFTPSTNGSYAVIISNATCADTSNCYSFNICNSWNPSTIVTNSNNVLTAQESGANYQWINCSNSNSIITGETAQSFMPSANGSYAVIISNATCADTSNCYSFNICNSWNPSTIVTNSNNVLTAQESGANYQWINCSNSNSIITGETAQSFTPSANGSYAVIISNATCADTTLCTSISTLNLDELSNNNIGIYPNPTNGKVTIQSNEQEMFLSISDASGRIIKTETILQSNSNLDLSNQKDGIYFFTLTSVDGKFTTMRLILKK